MAHPPTPELGAATRQVYSAVGADALIQSKSRGSETRPPKLWALSDDYDDMADSYFLNASEDRSLGDLAFSLGESDLGNGDWGDAMDAFSEGAKYYTDAAYAEMMAGIYRSIATALRAGGN